MQLGMIGLGRMGANMVRRLLRNQHTCVVYDRNPGVLRAERLVESIWILADYSRSRAIRAVFARDLWIRVLPESTRRTSGT